MLIIKKKTSIYNRSLFSLERGCKNNIENPFLELNTNS
jgi:hypothetical protein